MTPPRKAPVGNRRRASAGGAAGTFSRCVLHATQTAPDNQMPPHFSFRERLRTSLSAVSSVLMDLSSVLVRTKHPFYFNELYEFFGVSAVSSLFLGQ